MKNMTKEEIKKIAWNYLVDQAEGYFEDNDDVQSASLITEKVVNDCAEWSTVDKEVVKSYVDCCWTWHAVKNGKLILLRD